MISREAKIAERQVTILNELGFHVRPATDFAEIASRFSSHITLGMEGGRQFNAKSSIDLLMLAAVAGTKLILRAEGEDAQEAVDTLARLIQDKFGEE